MIDCRHTIQVWRIAFFGRLEERKGIKLFVQAVNLLQKQSAAVQADKFEVYIIGPDATIDMVKLIISISLSDKERPDLIHNGFPHYVT